MKQWCPAVKKRYTQYGYISTIKRNKKRTADNRIGSVTHRSTIMLNSCIVPLTCVLYTRWFNLYGACTAETRVRATLWTSCVIHWLAIMTTAAAAAGHERSLALVQQPATQLSAPAGMGDGAVAARVEGLSDGYVTGLPVPASPSCLGRSCGGRRIRHRLRAVCITLVTCRSFCHCCYIHKPIINAVIKRPPKLSVFRNMRCVPSA